MSLVLPLNEEQRDCLQELTNVAIGAAAESLANFTNHFVCLPIPVIRCINSSLSSELASTFDGVNSPISLVSQHCSIGDLDCYALVIVSDNSINELAKCSQQHRDTEVANTQLLKALFSTISDTCFEQLGEMFGVAVTRKNATIDALHLELGAFDLKSIVNLQQMIAVEIHYHMESHPFNCHLLLLFPENSIDKLALNLDRLLY